MSTPALLRLRERFPNAEVLLLCPQKLAPLWENHPGVDRVLGFQRGEGLFKVARRLKAEGVDIGISFPNSMRAALELWLGRVPRRVGYSVNGRRWFLTQVIPPDPRAVPMRKRTPAEVRSLLQSPGLPKRRPGPESHQLHHYLRLMSFLGADPTPLHPHLVVIESEKFAMRARLVGLLPESSRALAAGGWIGINPGAEYGPAKRWPAGNFCQMLKALRARGSRNPIVILGGAADIETAREVAAGVDGPVVNLAGQTQLRELMSVLAQLSVLVTNDTGPMHVAAALGTSLVVPFGSTSPELTGPGLPGDRHHYLLRSDVSCAPCFLRRCPIDLRCLTRITSEQVADAVLAILAPASKA